MGMPNIISFLVLLAEQATTADQYPREAGLNVTRGQGHLEGLIVINARTWSVPRNFTQTGPDNIAFLSLSGDFIGRVYPLWFSTTFN